MDIEDLEFKGTKDKWNYTPPTDRFDSCTISEKGKLIGYAAKNSSEDVANEKLRASAPALLEALINMVLSAKAGYTSFADITHSEKVIETALK